MVGLNMVRTSSSTAFFRLALAEDDDEDFGLGGLFVVVVVDGDSSARSRLRFARRLLVLLEPDAAAAESSGWDGFFLWDHVIRRRPWQAMVDPWVSLAAVAMATDETIKRTATIRTIAFLIFFSLFQVIK